MTLLDRPLIGLANGAVAFPLLEGDKDPKGNIIKTFPGPGESFDPRPSKYGDVLSPQPDGTLQGRTKVFGAFETATREGALLVYTNDAGHGATVFVFSLVGL